MVTRFFLDSVSKPDGTLWFTLVVEGPSHFFVEQYNDSVLSFRTGRIKTIKPAEFGDHSVNGMPLASLVEAKLKEIGDVSLQTRQS